ncbi:MAG: hypothetical protein U0230_02600 [Polyangiales bacterium]
MSDTNGIPNRRGLGRERGADGRYARVVDRFVVHGNPVDFRTLAERAVPKETKYLVLDLDRTLHLGRNMGELLGWEICAYLAYGADGLARMRSRGPGRFAVDLRDLGGSLRYLWIGAQVWAFPGLFYFVWAKLARLSGRLRRWSFLRFGPEPVRRVQSIPQLTMLQQLSTLPLETARELMRGIWERHRGDQVIERSDIDWLRARCPGIRIVLTSASPQPVVEVAAEMLGVDEVDYSAVEAANDRFAAPFGPGWVARRAAQPIRIAPPSRVRINSSHAKIEGLVARHPDLLEPGVITVGITDTGYGEDHCWGEWFTTVVDINSNSPFPPVVGSSSPLREVHSAHVLSRSEREQREAGHTGYLDTRRSPMPNLIDREVSATELAAELSDLLTDVEGVAARYDESEHRIEAARVELERTFGVVRGRVEELCRAYNEATDVVRGALLAELDALAEQFTRLSASLAEIERPVSEAAYRMTLLLESARRRLDPVPAVR